jgi:hypothetical protein
MPANDESLYLQAMQEVKSEQRHEGLWAKTLTLEKGNIEQAEYRYVQLRVEQLQLKPDVSKMFSLQPVSNDSVPDNENWSETLPINQSTRVEKKLTSYSFIFLSANFTKYTIIALGILVVMTGVAIVSDLMQLNLLENLEAITLEEAEANDKRVYIVDWLHIVAIIIAYILVLVWKYRTNKNCHGFGANDMRFTPGWAVGWHFVPIMNLFRPYQVMQEIWKVSTNPITWQDQRSSALIKWWWFSYLISGFFGKYSAKLSMKGVFKEETLDQLGLITTATIFSNCALIVSTILTILMISEIHEKQNQLSLL